LDIIEKTGYQSNALAKSLRTKKTNTIGVLVEDVLGFATPRIINGISEYVETTDYRILFSDLRMLESLYNQYDQIIQHKEKIHNELMFLVYGAKVDAVIYIGMFDRDVSGIIPDIGKPVVIAYSTSRDTHTCFVTYENEDVSAKMAQGLIDAGHRRIAVITGTATSPAMQRLKGIQRAFKQSGIELDSGLVKAGNWERDSGYVSMKEILQNPIRPTAVFAMNDHMAIGAMDAIKEAGLQVPRDISVVGFDNSEGSDIVSPKLTTVEIDLKALGFTAAQVVAERLAGLCGGKQEIVIPSHLVIRESVKKMQ